MEKDKSTNGEKHSGREALGDAFGLHSSLLKDFDRKDRRCMETWLVLCIFLH